VESSVDGERICSSCEGLFWEIQCNPDQMQMRSIDRFPRFAKTVMNHEKKSDEKR
jgi:hypothetical protein